MFCGKCGKQVPDGYEFCMHCGVKILVKPKIHIIISKKIIMNTIIAICSLLILFVVFVSINNLIQSFKNNEIIQANYHTIAVGDKHVIAVKKDGSVIATGNNEYGQCNVHDWNNVIAIDASDDYSIGLTRDGKVFFTGKLDIGTTSIIDLKDVVYISAGLRHFVVVHKNGKVTSIGNNEYGQGDIQAWKNVVIASAGDSMVNGHTIGLRSDGKVYFEGTVDFWGSTKKDVEKWDDIISIDSGLYHIVALKKDGTVVGVADSNDKFGQISDIDSWKNISKIRAAGNYSWAVNDSGNWLGSGGKNGSFIEDQFSNRFRNVDFSNVIDFDVSGFIAVGLKDDGTIISNTEFYENEFSFDNWQGILIYK